jgi:hypothetical protein
MTYTCPNPECKIKTFTFESEYKRHLKTKCGKPKKPTVCDICGKSFKYPSKLQEHLNSKKKCSPPAATYVYAKCDEETKQALFEDFSPYLRRRLWFDFITDYPIEVRNKINEKSTSIEEIVEMLLIPIFKINPGLIKGYGFDEKHIDSNCFMTSFKSPCQVKINNQYYTREYPDDILNIFEVCIRFILESYNIISHSIDRKYAVWQICNSENIESQEISVKTYRKVLKAIHNTIINYFGNNPL